MCCSCSCLLAFVLFSPLCFGIRVYVACVSCLVVCAVVCVYSLFLFCVLCIVPLVCFMLSVLLFYCELVFCIVFQHRFGIRVYVVCCFFGLVCCGLLYRFRFVLCYVFVLC